MSLPLALRALEDRLWKQGCIRRLVVDLVEREPRHLFQDLELHGHVDDEEVLDFVALVDTSELKTIHSDHDQRRWSSLRTRHRDHLSPILLCLAVVELVVGIRAMVMYRMVRAVDPTATLICPVTLPGVIHTQPGRASPAWSHRVFTAKPASYLRDSLVQRYESLVRFSVSVWQDREALEDELVRDRHQVLLLVQLDVKGSRNLLLRITTVCELVKRTKYESTLATFSITRHRVLVA